MSSFATTVTPFSCG